MWPFKKKKKIPVTLRAFTLLWPCCTQDYQQEMVEILHKQERPETLCGIHVPENLNMISYGTLDDLHGIKADSMESVYQVAEILLGITKEQLDQEDVNKVWGFVTFVTNEVDKINKLFEKIKPTHTSDEIRAGIEKLDFGSFGVLDWYAKRQGISNQNDVRDVAWVRIYQCMKMDNEQAAYEKRLREIISKKK